MKKLFYTLIILPLMNYAQCIIPPHFYGNTGSNMTVMLTNNFINSIPISDPNSYVVAVTTNGLVVGSSLVYEVSQTSIAIWEMTKHIGIRWGYFWREHLVQIS